MHVRHVVLIALAALAGCGAETGCLLRPTAAAARKQELEQAQKVLEQSRQKIDQGAERCSSSVCKPPSSLQRRAQEAETRRRAQPLK